MNTNRLLTLISLMCISLITAAAQPKIVAHRGFWNCDEAGFAKNSLAALKCAQEAGFWGSEFDVNMTSDGELIIYHDSDVEGKKIEKHPYSEFKDFRLKNGEPIPTVSQFLEQGKKYPGTMLVYELKPHSSQQVEDRFIELTIAKLKEHGMLDPQKVMFISFSFHICKELAAKLPGFTVQYLMGTKTPAEVKRAGINGIDYEHNILRTFKRWINKAHRLGMTVNSWTINKEEDMRRMLSMGIDHITTDYPLDARKLIAEMGLKK